jgi:hypothetical protein
MITLGLKILNCFEERVAKRIQHSNKLVGFMGDRSFNFGYACVPWLAALETALFLRVLQNQLNQNGFNTAGWKRRLYRRHAALLNM